MTRSWGDPGLGEAAPSQAPGGSCPPDTQDQHCARTQVPTRKVLAVSNAHRAHLPAPTSAPDFRHHLPGTSLAAPLSNTPPGRAGGQLPQPRTPKSHCPPRAGWDHASSPTMAPRGWTPAPLSPSQLHPTAHHPHPSTSLKQEASWAQGPSQRSFQGLTPRFHR